MADLCLPGHVQYVVGASGVVSALLVFFALALPHARVTLFTGFLWRLGQRSMWITLSVRWALALWLCEQVLGALLMFSGSSHISYAGHLGGALAGAVAFWWWRSD